MSIDKILNDDNDSKYNEYYSSRTNTNNYHKKNINNVLMVIHINYRMKQLLLL